MSHTLLDLQSNIGPTKVKLDIETNFRPSNQHWTNKVTLDIQITLNLQSNIEPTKVTLEIETNIGPTKQVCGIRE